MKALCLPKPSELVCLPAAMTGGNRVVQPKASCPQQAHIELNLIKRGLVTYRYGGNEIRVGAGRLAIFWAAIPHQIFDASSNVEVHTVTLPLTWFLQFRLPEEFMRPILAGQVLVEPEAGSRGDYEMVERWREDMAAAQSGGERIMMLEAEARLLRFANSLAAQQEYPQCRAKGVAACDFNSADRLQEMISFIAQNYTGQITVESIGKSAGLHPNYAMNLFRKTFGTTLGSYVTRYRVSHAQHLLATTDRKVLDIAMCAGFNSLSRFNDVFKRACGCSPREYRNRLDAPALN